MCLHTTPPATTTPALEAPKKAPREPGARHDNGERDELDGQRVARFKNVRRRLYFP
jgi:hypothetical protein